MSGVTEMTLRAKLSAIVRTELAKLGVLVCYEYRVVKQSGQLVDLQIVQKKIGVPDTPRVTTRPVAGYVPTYRPGDLVLVSFVAGDNARPFISHGPDAGTSTPVAVKINGDTVDLADGGLAVARVTDTAGRYIQDALSGVLYYSPGSNMSPQPYLPVAPNPNSPLPPSPTDPGTPVVIDSGSTKVNSG